MWKNKQTNKQTNKQANKQTNKQNKTKQNKTKQTKPNKQNQTNKTKQTKPNKQTNKQPNKSTNERTNKRTNKQTNKTKQNKTNKQLYVYTPKCKHGITGIFSVNGDIDVFHNDQEKRNNTMTVLNVAKIATKTWCITAQMKWTHLTPLMFGWYMVEKQNHAIIHVVHLHHVSNHVRELANAKHKNPRCIQTKNNQKTTAQKHCPNPLVSKEGKQ